MNNKSFSDEDVRKLNQLMSVLVAKAQFTLALNEFVDVFNQVDWVKKDLIPRINAHILEVKSIRQVNKPQEDGDE
jgi:hypothetical protein